MSDTTKEIETLKTWLSVRDVRVSSYRPKKAIDHPVLTHTQVIDGIAEAIKLGDKNAIELGCELVRESKKIPFGRRLKSNVLTALKQKAIQIDSTYKQQLTESAVKLLSWQYPPREVRELCKLVHRFEPKYVESVVREAKCTNKESETWLHFLKNGAKNP